MSCTEKTMPDITCKRPIEWKSAALTDPGVVRKLNEDAILSRPDAGLWAVADGMGGHELGDFASATVVEALESIGNIARLSDFVDAVEDALANANTNLLDYARANFGNATMGSTVAAMVIRDKIGVCLWAGDSRLYRYRRHKLEQLSRDHSQVEEMVQMGIISRSEAANHPQSNVITRAVGVEPGLYIEVTAFSARIGDTFLLCSDGLYGALDEDEIAASLAARDVEQSSEQLIAKSVASGAKDNVSVVIVQGLPGKLTQ